MLTVVLVGSSQTRRVARGDGSTKGGAWVYTPRGYAAKRATNAGEAAE
jgi:cobalt-precorrin 5A hydrolase/precorrin-3B C17-methyltransferase